MESAKDYFPNDEKTILEKNRKDIEDIFNTSPTLDFYEERKKLGKLLFEKVGLFRTLESLTTALEYVEYLITHLHHFGIVDKSKIYNTNLQDFLEFQNMVWCAKTVILGAIYRCESRGAHFRDDFPTSLESYKKSTIIKNDFRDALYYKVGLYENKY